MTVTTQTRKPRRGDQLEVLLERLDDKGRARGRSGEYSVAMRRAVPGMRVLARVRRRRRNDLEADLVEVIDPGPDAVPARCEHVRSCGGCSFQELAYAAQLQQLERSLGRTLEPLRQLGAPDPDPIVGSSDPWNYRNKMDFTFGNRRWIEADEPEGAPVGFAVGLHSPGNFRKVLDVSRCDIAFSEASAILSTARREAVRRGLSAWDVREHVGLLRHLVLRKGIRTGEILVSVVTSAPEPELLGPYFQALIAAHPEITTLVNNVRSSVSAVAVGEEEHVIHGSGLINEELHGLRFSISANSFFQTNTLQAELLVQAVLEEAQAGPADVIADLYCGGGSLTLPLAQRARRVRGFEIVPEALEDARRNAAANDLQGVDFVAGDLVETIGELEAGSTICVTDPPRAGMHPKVVHALGKLGPRRIVYVSCNPKAAVRDVLALGEFGYRVQRVRPLDLFPHTPHLECVFVLDCDASGG